MATDNPTAGDDPVRLSLYEHHEDFLRATLGAFKGGIERDLERDVVRPNRERLEQDIAAYERLLEGIAVGEVLPDEEVLQVAANLAESIDNANDYQQVMLEHRACCTLLMQLTEGAKR